MMQMVALLKRAIKAREIVTVTYNKGSRRGQRRQILPIFLSNDRLRVLERGLSTSKTYKLNRIAEIELANGQRVSNAEVDSTVSADVPALDTLTEYIDLYTPELEAANWYISKSEESFAIGTFFKNGKPRKTPSVLIQYRDTGVTDAIDINTGEIRDLEVVRFGRQRPWLLNSWRFEQGRLFSKLHRAFELFMQEARASDPVTAKVLFSRAMAMPPNQSVGRTSLKPRSAARMQR